MPDTLRRLVETAPPPAEPLALDDVKAFLRVDHSDDDALILSLIRTARVFCETFTGRSLIRRGYSLFLDQWPGSTTLGWWDGVQEGADILSSATDLFLPQPPLISVTRINVYAANGSVSEFPASGYFVDTAGVPGRVALDPGIVPPVPGRRVDGLEIQFFAGYGTQVEHVPMPFRHAIRQMTAHLYEFRADGPAQALTASGAAVFLHPYRAVTLS